MTGTGATSSKAKQSRGTVIVTTSSLAKEARSILTVGLNRICPNGRSGEDKCSNSMPQSEGRVHSTQPICHEYGLGK